MRAKLGQIDFVVIYSYLEVTDAGGMMLAADILSLSGKVALVTGAGQGVGRQVALHFAALGAKTILVNDYFADRASRVAQEVGDLGCDGVAVPTDVTDYNQVIATVQDAIERFGHIDIVVNNAGNAGALGSLANLPPFWETEPADWDRWLGTNLYGVLNVCRAVLPSMLEAGRGGSIVNVISDAGRLGEPSLAVYSAAKAGAAALSRSLARAVGAKGIRVNSVSLAAMNTPGVAEMIPDEATLKKILRQYLIPRLGEPTDAANMISFLASDASSWITGQTYPVNGGFSLNQ